MPPTIAVSISPFSNALTAWSSATSDDEQAVSIVMLGPRSPNMCEIRLETMESVLPVMKYGLPDAGSSSVRLPCSREEAPT